jgi:pimeloyl-ACP methyl ester carboxylesterase
VTTVRANGIDFHISRFRSGPEGERPIIVCIHGLLMVDKASMSMTVGMALATQFDVILYDLRGHGRSQFVPSGYRVEDHVADLLALLDELGITKPVHLLGGSFGGAIAVTAALHHPERVASLSMIDSSFPLPDWGPNLARDLEEGRRRMQSGYDVEEVMEFLQTNSRRRATAIAERGRRLLTESTLLEDVRQEETISMEQYAGITCPVLAVYGTGSAIYVLSVVLSELIKSAEIVTVPDANHILIFSRPETRAAVADFVSRVEAQRALLAGPVHANGSGAPHPAESGEAATG